MDIGERRKGKLNLLQHPLLNLMLTLGTHIMVMDLVIMDMAIMDIDIPTMGIMGMDIGERRKGKLNLLQHPLLNLMLILGTPIMAIDLVIMDVDTLDIMDMDMDMDIMDMDIGGKRKGKLNLLLNLLLMLMLILGTHIMVMVMAIIMDTMGIDTMAIMDIPTMATMAYGEESRGCHLEISSDFDSPMTTTSISRVQ